MFKIKIFSKKVDLKMNKCESDYLLYHVYLETTNNFVNRWIFDV